MRLEEFNECMIYLGVAYNKEFTQNEIKVYYDFLKNYNIDTLKIAIKSIISKSKYAPKISELIEECDNCKSSLRNEVLKYMRETGYFKLGIIRENGEQIILTDEHAMRNYEKASRFLERGIIPDWLQEDINYYYKLMKQEKLSGSSQQLLN